MPWHSLKHLPVAHQDVVQCLPACPESPHQLPLDVLESLPTPKFFTTQFSRLSDILPGIYKSPQISVVALNSDLGIVIRLLEINPVPHLNLQGFCFHGNMFNDRELRLLLGENCGGWKNIKALPGMLVYFPLIVIITIIIMMIFNNLSTKCFI